MATVDFQPYLRSLLASPKYKQWQDLYTETDAASRAQSSQRSSREIDLQLMAEIWQPSKEKAKQILPEEEGDKEEKVETLPVLEALQKYASEQVLLVGRPGSGKSTTLERLLLQQAQAALSDRAVEIPVLVELRSYRSSTLDCIQDVFAEYSLELSEAQIEELLTEGKLLLLFDGVNELPSEKARQELAQFRKDYSVPAIFTTRELSSGGNLSIEKRLEMQPLNNAQIKEFVLAYLPETGEELLRKLDDRLEEIRRTPLFLWMLCKVFENYQQVPEDLGKLFRFFAEHQDVLKVKQEGVNVNQELRDRASELLQVLAVAMMQGETRVDMRLEIPYWEAEKALAQWLQQKGDQANRAGEWLQGLLAYHLVQLERDQTGRELVQFRHQLIQEYYAAEWLLKQLETLDDDCLKQQYLNYLKWTEPIAMMLNLLADREQAIRVVKLALEVDLQLGARLAGEVQEKWQWNTVKMLLEYDLPKLVTIELLKKTKSANAIEFLTQALNDSNFLVRERAAEALEEIGSEQAITPLRQVLHDSNPGVRSSAAEALGEIGGDQTVNILRQVLYDSDPRVRSNIVKALGKIGSEQAISPLLLALDDSNSDVSHSAVFALGKIGSEQTVAPLMEALKNSNVSVQKFAAEALGEIRSKQAVPALLQALNYSDSGVRRSAAKALGVIGSQQAVTPLLEAFNHYSDFDMRRTTAFALGEIGSEQAVTTLMQSLNHFDSEVFGMSAKALGEIGSEQAVPALMESLNHSDSIVRCIVAKTLGNIGSEQAVTALLQALDDSDFAVRSSAAEALGKIAYPEILPHLREFIPTEIGTEILSAIAAIQECYKFYNYEIYQQPLPKKSSPTLPQLGNTYISIQESQIDQLAGHDIKQRDNIETQNNSP